MSTILIVEDDRDTQTILKMVLENKKYNIIQALNGKTALELAESTAFDAVILDLVLGDIDGLEVLEKLKTDEPGLPVIILTGHADVQSAVKAMKLGAVDYLIKPFSNEELVLIIEKAVRERRFFREYEALKSHISSFHSGDVVFGNSAEIKKVLEMSLQVAKTDLTVILYGHSGSGKEVWARQIHKMSLRNKNPFVALDCGAIPENLVESELFGYEKGAFTGADRRKLGLFEIAFGGTLFLDEISNLSISTQAKLLRVLQEKRIRHLGGKKDIPVDVRIIVATNRDLLACTKDGTFREDLYHRLNQFTIVLPNLADRKEDIPVLVHYFIKEANKALKKNIDKISDEAIKVLKDYSWPGNIRELQNTITRAVLIADKEILPEHLGIIGTVPERAERAGTVPEQGLSLNVGAQPVKDLNLKKSVRAHIKELEKQIISQALNQTGGNKLKASKILGIDRKALYYKLKEYKI